MATSEPSEREGVERRDCAADEQRDEDRPGDRVVRRARRTEDDHRVENHAPEEEHGVLDADANRNRCGRGFVELMGEVRVRSLAFFDHQACTSSRDPRDAESWSGA